MNFDQPSNIEQPGKNREKLLALEKEGKYVFHGSPEQIEILEPRQAEGKNEVTGEMERDGAPAVFATQYADMAIFRALVNAKGVFEDSESSFGIDDDGLHFSATRNLLEAAKRKTGKVYVLDRSKFDQLEAMQCRSHGSVAPLQAVEVTYDDLPKNIRIIES